MQDLAGALDKREYMAVKLCVFIESLISFNIIYLGTESRHQLVLPGGCPRPIDFIQAGF